MREVTIARRHIAALIAPATCALWLGACATSLSPAPDPNLSDEGVAGSAGATQSGGNGGAVGSGAASGSSNGGSSGSAGTAGTGGASGNGASGASGASGSGGVSIVDLIDDFESGDGSLPATNGRDGAWYSYNDETVGGVQSPVPATMFTPESGGPSGAGLAAHTTGSGFTLWGAGIGADFNNNGSVRGSYDASAYQGVTFWARGSVTLNFKILSAPTTPIDQGGTCSATDCEDHHQAAVSLNGSWAQYSFSFAELTQQGWGSAATFNAKEVISLQFEVEQDTAFDFWVDDIGFY